MFKRPFLPFFVVGFLIPLPAKATAIEAVANAPVVDVWSEPAASTASLTDDKRETQVLLGEHVLIHESSGSWVRIEATAQPEFTHHNKWEGYPGWALAAAFRPKTDKDDSAIGSYRSVRILEFAESAIGTPYLWGGLSKGQGLDCSGLVHMAYREYHRVIPRDAYEQWMKSGKIKRNDLRPNDLVFSAKANAPSTVTHVALYAGDGQLIEAPQAGMAVRKISFKEKFGKELSSVETGDRVGDRVIYFGRYLE
jgi:cell wall-associated NlpC family hydrolase